MKPFNNSPYFTLKPIPSSKLSTMSATLLEHVGPSEHHTHSCSRPKGVRISAPSLYVHEFKKSRGPVAENPVLFGRMLDAWLEEKELDALKPELEERAKAGAARHEYAEMRSGDPSCVVEATRWWWLVG